MLDFLQEIDEKIFERYLTVLRNIKSGSNSFYDSFLDLQEEFVKFVCTDNGIDLSVRETCGEILKRKDVVELFQSKLNLDKYFYEKMQDYTLKVNNHKHKKEKNIQVDTILNYMNVFYQVLSAFCKLKNIEQSDFDVNYYAEIFGVYEKENISLKNEMQILKDELKISVEKHKLKDCDIEIYKSICNKTEIEKLSLEEQNEELHKQISKLKDIKLSSMEDKLNKTIDLLNELTDSVIENRVIVRAVGRRVGGLINGDSDVDSWIAKEKGTDKNG